MDVTSLYTNIPIKIASRHARKFGRKEKSTHLHRLWLNFWPSYSNAISLSSTGVQRETLSPGPWHCYGYQNGTCIRQHFHGSSRGTVVEAVALRPLSWLRFIDDIDMNRSHGRETLTTFLDEANNYHPSIKFTAEIPTKQHVFLDTKPSLVGDTISLALYTKPTDTHHYLLPTSCHPKHCCKVFLTALHFASDVSAPIRTLLSQEQENSLTTSANGVIRNRKFHLPLRAHGNKREKTYFRIGLNPSRTFSLRVDISPRLAKSERYSQQTLAHH